MSGARMSGRDALAVVHRVRGPRDVVVTTMATSRDWMLMPQTPLDVVFVPSAMGHATSLGLGLALAQPDRRVIVCNGDGSMLMNLGSLVSIVEAAAINLIVVVFENGTYEVTGSQRAPGAGMVDFAGMARSAGFRCVYDVSTVDEWRRLLGQVLDQPGPTFVTLRVEPVYDQPGPKSPGAAKDRAQRFMEALRQ